MSFSFVELARKAELTKPEATAVVEVLAHYGSYMNDFAVNIASGISLSDFVTSRLIDDGLIAGIEFGGGDRTLEKYSSDLASALRKMDAQLPKRSGNPLASVGNY